MDGGQRVEYLARGLRARVLVRCASDADDLGWVWVTSREVRRQHEHLLGSGAWRSVLGSTRFTEADLVDVAAREVAALTGLSLFRASAWIAVADVLCGSMPGVVEALAQGRIDLARATTVAEECSGLDAAACVTVEAAVLATLPERPLEGTGVVGPWDGRSPRAFTALVRRAVAEVRVQSEEDVRAELRARTGTWVQVDPANPAVATWTITGPTEQLVAAEETVAAAVRAMSVEELAGRTRGMAKVDLLCDALLGGGVGGGNGGVRRELGVVLHADTLVGDGPAAQAAGEVRGVGYPVPATAAAARVMANDAEARGAHTCVLVADDGGRLVRVLRVGVAPENGWTRAALVAAARAAARAPAVDETENYVPTARIADHVRARDPVCTFPGCGVPASRCDLDHVVPHPRGPTSTINLSPRSRRCHRLKTAALWRCRTRLTAGGQVVAHEWTSPLGTTQVVPVPPLPGP